MTQLKRLTKQVSDVMQYVPITMKVTSSTSWLMTLVTLVTLVQLVCADSLKPDKKSPSQPSARPERDRKITDEVELMETLLQRGEGGYNKQNAPRLNDTTEVQIGIYVNSFYSINEQFMEYSLNFYLRQRWRDPRLEYSRMGVSWNKMKVDSTRWQDLWVPDTFFRNEKKASTHLITVDNRLISINASGFVWYVTKISATLTCNMHLSKYPMDVQRCPVLFESFGYTMDVMYFAWLDDAEPAKIDDAVELPQFKLRERILNDCSASYLAGNFTCLEIVFVLQRDFGFYLIQMYIPSVLIVILSWVSFWINVDSSPARVSLGLLTVLTLTTQSTSIRASLPRVSYIKAIDVWMSMCLVFTFLSLIEYAVVNTNAQHNTPLSVMPLKVPLKSSFFRRERNKNQANHVPHQVRIVEGSNSILQAAPLPPTPSHPPEPAKPVEDGKARAKKLDKFSRKAFPLSFLLFNIIYWLYYTLSESNAPTTQA